MARPARPWYYKQTDSWMAYLDGRKVRLARGRKNRREAERALEDLKRQREANPAPRSDEPTVAAVIETYLDWAKKERRYDGRSLDERVRYLQAFAEALGWQRVRDCVPYDLTRWVAENSQWASDWTKAQVINIVQRPFNWAARQRLISANPFLGVTHEPGAARRPLTDTEFQSLMRACQGRRSRQKPSPAARFRQVLVFLRYTGCRPGELCRLRWADIDLGNAVIVLNRYKGSRQRRVKVPRIIPLDPVVVKLLISIRRREEPGELVFHTHRGTPWNRSNLSLRMRRARAKAGIPDDAKLYGLRHGFGTRSIVNGVDLKTLSTLMGHSTTRMTEHYVHLAGQQSHLAAAMRRANGRRRDA
jgi:integrase